MCPMDLIGSSTRGISIVSSLSLQLRTGRGDGLGPTWTTVSLVVVLPGFLQHKIHVASPNRPDYPTAEAHVRGTLTVVYEYEYEAAAAAAVKYSKNTKKATEKSGGRGL